MILHHAQWNSPKRGDVFTDNNARTRTVIAAAARWVIAR